MSKEVAQVPGVGKIKNVGFLRLLLRDTKGKILSRNVYWLTPDNDKMDWDDSTWYYTPVTDFIDYSALEHMKGASVKAMARRSGSGYAVTLQNQASVPAFFIRLNLVDGRGQDITPVAWEDNYVTLFPKETTTLALRFAEEAKGAAIEMSGGNIKTGRVMLGG